MTVRGRVILTVVSIVFGLGCLIGFVMLQQYGAKLDTRTIEARERMIKAREAAESSLREQAEGDSLPANGPSEAVK